MHWRFLDTGFHAGDYNMALDAALAKSGFCDRPTLRVFRWQPFCISLGYHQNAAEIEAEKCALAGIDVARRPTAGRAILHSEELTYSVVIPASHPWFEMLPLDFYRRISEAIAAGLQSLGIDTQFAPGEKLHHDGRPLRLSCFASAARNEIAVQGKKVVGSAQRRFREGVLQHGSIILQDGHERLVDFLIGESAALAAESSRLQEHTTSLSRIAEREVTFEETVSALRRGFERVLEAVFLESRVLPEENELAEAWRERYRIISTNQHEVSLCKNSAPF
jgi:lipoate-protein ligase A